MPPSLHEDMRRWRHDIHRHPEFGFEEQRTAGVVAEALRSFGLEVHEGIGTTGVVGVLQRGRANRAMGLRADMDCLMIQEQNTFAHRSVHDGIDQPEHALLQPRHNPTTTPVDAPGLAADP